MVYFSSNSEYFEDFIENLIFHVNASNGTALQWETRKTSNFIKIYNIS